MLKWGLLGREGSNLLKSRRPLTSRTPGCPQPSILLPFSKPIHNTSGYRRVLAAFGRQPEMFLWLHETREGGEEGQPDDFHDIVAQ